MTISKILSAENDRKIIMKIFFLIPIILIGLLFNSKELEGQVKNPKSVPVEIICLLDRSGSMNAIVEDAVGGFNSFLEEQQKLPGEANLTVVFFNSENPFDIWCEGTPIRDVQKMTEEDYSPANLTPLLDAIGKTIVFSKERANKLCGKNNQKVIMAILTDGLENYSREYKKDQIFDSIQKQKKDHGWEFVFLAANQDAIESGSSYGFTSARSVNYAADSVGTRAAYGTVSTTVRAFRSGLSGADLDSVVKANTPKIDTVDDKEKK